jgi:HlyD family secretion protein
MKKPVIILLSIFLLAIVGVVLYSKSKKPEGKEVETTKITERTIIETVSATGKIQPETEVKISSEVSGEIIFLPIKEGDQVKKGQILARVNPELYTSGYNRSVASLSNTKAVLTQATAALAEAEANFKRNKPLFEKGIISKAEWDRVVASFETAKANKEAAYFTVQSASATVNEAKESLGRTTIYAPMDGTISLLNAELGERVVGTQQMAGTEIMRVANLNSMEVEVDVNENDIVKISIGDEANIEVDAYLKKQFKGVVTSISNTSSTALTADQVTNFKVKVRILRDSYQDLLEGKPENYSPFRPGMTATVDIITKKKEKVLAVPISAVVVKSDTSANATQDDIAKSTKKMECVFVKVNGKAKIKVIKTGIQDETYLEVLEGLKKEEEVITGPYTLVSKELKSGDAVVLKKEEVNKK